MFASSAIAEREQFTRLVAATKTRDTRKKSKAE